MEERQNGCIEFETEDNEKISFYVLEETMINGKNYLLVADSDEEEEEAQAFIMRAVTDDENQTVYEIVEEDTEFEAVSKIFAELLDDVDFEM